MSSRSSSSADVRPVPLGTVGRFRGREGEFTVRVASGQAGRWASLKRVTLAAASGEGTEKTFAVERCRSYRDRLVLKLEGIDGPEDVESLRGRLLLAPADEVPALPEGEHYVARLVGLEVVDERGAILGRIADVVETGGADLLVVEDGRGGEILVPLAERYVRVVDERNGRVTVALPDGWIEEGGS